MLFPIDGDTNPSSISADSRTLLILDESTRTLYNRAISNPSLLTDQERRLITHRSPPDEEDTLCRNACGLSMGELVAKAINSSSLGLSYKEASLLTTGVLVEGQSGHILSEVARLSSEDRDLKARAMEAATTDDIRAAREVAQRVKQRWLEVELAAAEALNDDGIKNIRFSAMLSNHEIPAGFRRDAFLYVDDEAFRSCETTRPYLWLTEPEPQSESKTQREPGTETVAQPEALKPLKVDIKHIAPTLFARLVQRDLQGEARRKPYRHTSELTRLHAAVNAKYREERDGIWPPPARFQ
ncbi:hypothetical protein AbraIFM66950_004420 [Aspergillus brasiliensis]|nr:hypothetical protein AbraIFM66950_004420 [Aspergillus brasiliensis]